MMSLYVASAWVTLICGSIVNLLVSAVTLRMIKASRVAQRHTIGAWLASVLAFVPVLSVIVPVITKADVERSWEDDEMFLRTMKQQANLAALVGMVSHFDAWITLVRGRRVKHGQSSRGYVMWLLAGVFSAFSVALYALEPQVWFFEQTVRAFAIIQAVVCVVIVCYGYANRFVWFFFQKRVEGKCFGFLAPDSLFGLELFLHLDYTRPPMQGFWIVSGYLIITGSLISFVPIFLKAAQCGPDWFATSTTPARRAILIANMSASLWASHIGPFIQTMWKKKHIDISQSVVLLFSMLPVHSWLLWAAMRELAKGGGEVPEFQWSCAAYQG